MMIAIITTIIIIITKDPLHYAWKMLDEVYIILGVNVYMYVFKYTYWVLRVANKQIIYYNMYGYTVYVFESRFPQFIW